ncbi:MAG: DNA polymerase domain-containing protein [Rhabdochlamydiaceae bacterium]
MTFWIKSRGGKIVKLRDKEWRAKIYASGEACDSPEWIFSKVKSLGLVHSIKAVEKTVDISQGTGKALEIELEECDKGKKVADLLESAFQNPATFQLYNVDVLPEQQYFFEKDLFPLAYLRVESDDENQVTSWQLLDDITKYDYSTPDLNILRLAVKISSKVPRMDARLVSLSLNDLVVEGKSEPELLCDMLKEVEKLDPDLIITQNGDSFVLPFLYSKGKKYSIDLKGLNRDSSVGSSLTELSKLDGKTYFSYGRILFRPTTQRFYGRLHLDEQNTVIYDQCQLQGLYEITRLCRMPIHTSARASIGKCLSGLQFYHATKRDILIPWKPTIAEDVKTGYDLLYGDRGGLVLTPKPGINEQVCEIDYASLYPSIIRDYNISAETVNCSCCQPSTNRIEELMMHICNEKRGLVAESLELPIERRFEYKKMRDSTPDKSLKSVYNERAGALKGILVCSFGYLSYRNAKFGKIDSHMAVCSIARKTLRDSIQIANLRGFRIIHGIIDSLWISKRNATIEDYREISMEIEARTGFKLGIEGIYKWIVFLPSKVFAKNQVPTRYFGCFESGEIKARGIELRRHDTPIYFKKCQNEVLGELAKCDNALELGQCARREGRNIFEKYAKALEQHEVPALELLINRRLSKDIRDYRSKRQLQVNAVFELEKQGFKLRAGQSVSYVIAKYKSKGQNRSIPEELAVEETQYDSERYVELLADCCATVLFPFGITKQNLLSRSESLLAWR